MNDSWQSLIESRAQNKQISAPTHLSILYFFFTFQENYFILLFGNGLWRVLLTLLVWKNRFNLQNSTLKCDKKSNSKIDYLLACRCSLIQFCVLMISDLCRHNICHGFTKRACSSGELHFSHWKRWMKALFLHRDGRETTSNNVNEGFIAFQGAGILGLGQNKIFCVRNFACGRKDKALFFW